MAKFKRFDPSNKKERQERYIKGQRPDRFLHHAATELKRKQYELQEMFQSSEMEFKL
jgi:translation initiation factor 2 alpha subunit (eIF-2alpha)